MKRVVLGQVLLLVALATEGRKRCPGLSGPGSSRVPPPRAWLLALRGGGSDADSDYLEVYPEPRAEARGRTAEGPGPDQAEPSQEPRQEPRQEPLQEPAHRPRKAPPSAYGEVGGLSRGRSARRAGLCR